MTDPRPEAADRVALGDVAVAQRRLLCTAVGAGVSVAVLLAGTIFFTLPSNVMASRDGGALRSASVTLMPQSWAFFTKPPNDAEVVAYRVEGTSTTLDSRLPNSRAENLFGLSRAQRAQGPELAAIVNAATEWTDCGGRTATCVADVAAGGEPQTIMNGSTVPTLCGRYVVAQTEPVPWAFRDDYEGWRLDRQASLVELECR